MLKIHMTRQFFEVSGLQGHFFEKYKKQVFGYGLGECGHWPGAPVQTHYLTDPHIYK